MKRLILIAIAGSVVLAACGSSGTNTSSSTTGSSTSTTAAATITTGNPTAAVTLNESGSSLLYPYLQELVSPLHTQFPNITLAPAAGGSGKGISEEIGRAHV